MHSQSYHAPMLNKPVWILCTRIITLPLHLTHPTSKHPTPTPSLATHWISAIRGGVENLIIHGIRQGYLELTVLRHSLVNSRNTKMLSSPPLYVYRYLSKTKKKRCYYNQPWGNSNILFSDKSTAPANKTKIYAPIDSEHKFHQEVLHTWILVGIDISWYYQFYYYSWV